MHISMLPSQLRSTGTFFSNTNTGNFVSMLEKFKTMQRTTFFINKVSEHLLDNCKFESFIRPRNAEYTNIGEIKVLFKPFIPCWHFEMMLWKSGWSLMSRMIQVHFSQWWCLWGGLNYSSVYAVYRKTV